MFAVLTEKLPSKVLSHTGKFDWICRRAESFTLDKDGKSVSSATSADVALCSRVKKVTTLKLFAILSPS